jgi:flagellar biosynthesis protein FlgN
VEAELEALAAFLGVLESEQQILKLGQIDALPDIARNKSDLLVKLSQLGAARDSILSQHGISPDKNSIAQFLSNEDRNGQLLLNQNWEKLLTSAQRAQVLNQHNGAMIEAMLKHNQQALTILQQSHKQSGLYGPDGQTHSIAGGRRLGKI